MYLVGCMLNEETLPKAHAKRFGNYIETGLEKPFVIDNSVEEQQGHLV